METHILVGADDVRAGGNAMREAAQEMKNAAGMIEDSLNRHRQFMDDWLDRFSSALNSALEESKK